MVQRIPTRMEDTQYYLECVKVTLKDAIYERSTAVRHTAEFLENITQHYSDKYHLIKVSDGGVDENPLHARAMYADLASFFKGDYDYLAHFCNAGGDSRINPVERCIGSISHALYGTCLVRKKLNESEKDTLRKKDGSQKDFRSNLDANK
ncbi:hypothetical protein SARC_06353 [Sphaeroforma arctica JP610]|uniref:Uncharacterized protein n=1 Tax=Sphaeroforma arctica JP610 TaxID=667725 RepID=A0A0L0FZC2_9EUKA|nr:hypothetical protein SARC_06353 [Sphaeroforma arctica JP610]KNC81318.1 hypothetical protein SARC_06353 [Sphaeroforma arctica JP610]|eukprot:XP_014155220.1 hypothetical protein SARC_06353 [Sphaeroforma arctica JP610]